MACAGGIYLRSLEHSGATGKCGVWEILANTYWKRSVELGNHITGTPITQGMGNLKDTSGTCWKKVCGTGKK